MSNKPPLQDTVRAILDDLDKAVLKPLPAEVAYGEGFDAAVEASALDILRARIAELEAAGRSVVAIYRDTDPTIREMHPSIDQLRIVLGMSSVPDER